MPGSYYWFGLLFVLQGFAVIALSPIVIRKIGKQLTEEERKEAVANIRVLAVVYISIGIGVPLLIDLFSKKPV